MNMRYLNSVTHGFALPSVMIASVVMLMVLTSALVAATSSNTALRTQYENDIVNQAVDAGKAFVVGCLQQTGGATNWPILYPNSSCTTTASTNLCPDTGAPTSCFLVDQATRETTFTVSAATANADGSRTLTVKGILRSINASGTTTVKEIVATSVLTVTSGGSLYVTYDMSPATLLARTVSIL